ncbi:hypothetical protein LSAT2_017489, partial [Lamellibrachia satsuma]
MIWSVFWIPQEKLDKLHTVHKLTHHDRIPLGELCEILAPFEAATDFAQGDKVVTASLVIPSVYGLRCQIKAKYNCKMVESLKKSTEQRMYVYKEQASFRLAATPDPHFKLAWFKDTCEAEKQSTSLLAATNILAPPPVSFTQSQPESSASSPPAKWCKLFSFMGVKEAIPSSASSTAEEIETYLSNHVLLRRKTQLNTGIQDQTVCPSCP